MNSEWERKRHFKHQQQEDVTETGEGGTQEWTLQPENKRHGEAAFELGNRHFTANDAMKAIRWYERAASAGHVVAQYNLGLIYLKGEHVPWDGLKGFEWLRRAAKGGDIKAQALLGKLAPRHIRKRNWAM